MMLDDAALLELVYAAIDEYNASASVPLAKTEETVLYGGEALDSLGLVQLIIALEQNVLDRTGRALALASDKAFSQARSPFRDVTSLAAYLRQRLQQED
jgi:hypothetical protein